MIGLYLPGRSVLHRLPAGLKLVLLAVAVVGVLLLGQPWQIGVALLVVTGLYVAADVPVRTAAAQLRPLLWVIPVIVVFQFVFADWRRAVVVSGMLLVNVALAALLTLTTTVTAILDVCTRALGPLRRFGVDPDRVGLVLALTIRCIPLMTQVVRDVWAARMARGVTGVRGSMVSLAAPAVVRALRTADAIGEALTARGLDD